MKKQNKENDLGKMRHSCAHILAAAVSKLYPGAKLGIGPSIETGFYYDFDFPRGVEISEKDFGKIEKEMQKIIFGNHAFEKSFSSINKAIKDLKKEEQEYTVELVEDLKKQGEKKVNFYQSGDFSNLCKGPHLKSTGGVGALKLLSVAGAYWRGSEKNKMLTRIYGTCFPTKKELDQYLKALEEAKKRDHRKLNKVLKLYQLSDDLGQGLVTLLPNGTTIALELENWAKETEREWGYVQVLTPHIAKKELYEKTGHLPYYADHMYPPMKMEEKGEGENEVYYLKPMNCSMHNLVFKSEPRSYRDLPLRVAEYGTVYRYEQSGELHGMMRVRGPIHQNDAHIFCTEEQAEEEFKKVMDLHKYYYDAFGLGKKDYYLSFATRDESHKDKFLGNDKMWKKAQGITLKYIKKCKIPYEIEEGGAAFYGPKIDFNIRTVTGKVFSASTNQIDFFIPQAFKLKYTDKNGEEKTPVCIHRAPLGAHVRFIAFLTEHFAGNFPVWLHPLQVKILPITEKQAKYGQKIMTELKKEGIRVSLDESNQTLSYKIRQGQLEKVPFLLIVGPREEKEGKVAIRQRDGKDLGAKSLNWFLKELKELIKNKSLDLLSN